MAHPESILLAMVFDEDETIRKNAVTHIISMRKSVPEGVRIFEKPKINFDCKKYYDMVLKEEFTTPPPLFEDFSNEDLAYAAKGLHNLTVADIPCHSVNNERLVQATSQALKYSVGEEKVHQHFISSKFQPGLEKVIFLLCLKKKISKSLYIIFMFIK